MRLLVVMPVASPWAREHAMRICELGHEVHVVSFPAGLGAQQYLSSDDAAQTGDIERLRERVASLRIVPGSGSLLRYLAAAPALRRMAKELEPDLLLTLYGGGPAMSAWLSGVRPYAVYLVGSDVLLLRSRARRALSTLSIRRASHVFANGIALADRARAIFGRPDVEALYLGIDLSRFTVAPAHDPPRIVCTRGFAPVYDNETILAALARMKNSVPATFVAGGPGLDGARAMAGEGVTFVGGCAPDGVARALSEADVYVSMSRSDGTSTSLMEALAAGLYPVLSDIPASREWIDPATGNGTLVPVGDVEALAVALDDAVTDQARRARARDHNTRLVSERADARANAARMMDSLKHTLNDR